MLLRHSCLPVPSSGQANQPTLGLVRRLMILVATVAIVGVVVYRQRTIDRWERTLGIGDNSGDAARG
jgi:hypothetical protein